MVKNAKWALGIAAWLMASAVLPAHAQKPNDSAAKALVSKAIQASDIEAKGSTPFRLEARVRLDLGGNQSENGKLVLIWTPAGWWHEEMTLDGYRRIEISAGKEIWTKSTIRYLPYPAFLTERAVTLWNWLRRAKRQELSGPATSSLAAQACVTATKISDPVSYCFDALTGDLARVVDNRWNVTIRYSEYAPFGARSFPRLMQVGRRGERPFIEVRVVQLAQEEKPDLRLFLPVKGAKRMPAEGACGKVEAAQLKKMVRPKYPPEAEGAGISGIVKLYAVIGRDGIARGMWPVNSSTPVLTGAATRAIRQWRYQPRTCRDNGTKLPQIQLITILFSSP